MRSRDYLVHIRSAYRLIWQSSHISCQYHRVSTPAGTTSGSIERLDAPYDWLPAPPGQSAPLEFFGNGCTDVQPYDLHGKVRAAGMACALVVACTKPGLQRLSRGLPLDAF